MNQAGLTNLYTKLQAQKLYQNKGTRYHIYSKFNPIPFGGVTVDPTLTDQNIHDIHTHIEGLKGDPESFRIIRKNGNVTDRVYILRVFPLGGPRLCMGKTMTPVEVSQALLDDVAGRKFKYIVSS